MRFESRTAALIRGGFLPLGRNSLQSTQRIETFEVQTTVIAKKLVQTGNPKHHQGVAVAALNSGALTSWAPHGYGNLTNLIASVLNNFLSEEE